MMLPRPRPGFVLRGARRRLLLLQDIFQKIADIAGVNCRASCGGTVVVAPLVAPVPARVRPGAVRLLVPTFMNF